MHYKGIHLWTLLGHLYYKIKNIGEAKQAYETAISLGASNDAVLYLRLGAIYLQMEMFEDAKNSYLNAAKVFIMSESNYK